METVVIGSRQITPGTHSVMLMKPKGFHFRPTQFTFVSLMTENGIDVRPMSIATSPTRPHLEYAVRTSDYSYKRAFSSLRQGDRVGIQGPHGRFLLREDRAAVLIAGGIGITPLKGMAEYAADKQLAIPVRLLYSNHSEEEIAFRAEIEELARQNPHFRVNHTLTGDEVPKGWDGAVGRIDSGQLERVSSGLKNPVYYVCGKPAMVSAMVGLLSDLGVSQADIALEVFRGYAR